MNKTGIFFVILMLCVLVTLCVLTACELRIESVPELKELSPSAPDMEITTLGTQMDYHFPCDTIKNRKTSDFIVCTRDGTDFYVNKRNIIYIRKSYGTND